MAARSGKPVVFMVAAFCVVLFVAGLVSIRGPMSSSDPLRTLGAQESNSKRQVHTPVTNLAVGEKVSGSREELGLIGRPFFSLMPDKPKGGVIVQTEEEVRQPGSRQQWPQQRHGDNAGQQQQIPQPLGSVGQQRVPQQVPQLQNNVRQQQQIPQLQDGVGVGQQPPGRNTPPQRRVSPFSDKLGQDTDLAHQTFKHPGSRPHQEILQLGNNSGVPLQTVQQPVSADPVSLPISEVPVPTVQPLPTFYPSKDLFVRAVHFDSRPRDGHHNASVFLVVCLKTITDNNLIQGCQVDGQAANKFSVKLIGETPLWRAFYNYINHEEVLVHCYDLPARNGSTGHIAYRKTAGSVVVLAASERPLLMPAPRVDPTSKEGKKYNLTVVACAKIFNHPPWLEEWLTYQRTLGMDHIHLDAEDSFQKNGMMQKPFVARMIDEGFLSVDIWKEYLSGSEIWYHNQGLIYEDCPYRFRGTYDYIIMMDTDDFFTPRVPTEKKIHYYIDRFCRGKGIGSCKFKWVEYYPDAVGMNSSVSIADGNVTRALTSYSHYNQGNPKSLHRTTVLIDTATHYAYLMMPGYTIVPVSVNIAYVAHVRLYKKVLPKPHEGLVTGLPT